MEQLVGPDGDSDIEWHAARRRRSTPQPVYFRQVDSLVQLKEERRRDHFRNTQQYLAHQLFAYWQFTILGNPKSHISRYHHVDNQSVQAWRNACAGAVR